jgi:superfamily I DNA/RNA helicase
MAREFRVFGPPGTGKTRYVAEQAQRASEKYGSAAVVICSLTRTAAAEIGARASQTVPPQNVGTLHAHAFRALGRPSLAETREGLAQWNEFAAKVSPRLKVSDKSSVDPENYSIEQGFAGTEGEALLSELANFRARQIAPEFFPPRVRRFGELWATFKDTTQRVDFTDLIEVALAEIDVHPSRPMAFFLDEAQDMSRLELALARKWGERCDAFVIVGDPFQNLYEWRGSEPEAFTSHEADQVLVLEQSYRVPQAVHRYAVQWAKQITSMEFPAYLPRDEAGEVRVAPHVFQYPDTIMRDIEADLAEGREVMVLASCGYMLNPLIAALRESGTPFYNPYRTTHGGWNPLRGAARVLAFLAPQYAGRLWTWPEVHQWVDPLAASGVLVRGAKTWIESKAQLGRFDDERDMPPVELNDVLNMFVNDEHKTGVFDMDVDWLLEHARASRKQALMYPVKVFKEHGLPGLQKQPHLVLGTIHSVKGGEADSVYVFPDMSNAAMRDLNRDAMVRQFYVAFTRAKQKLTLCEASGRATVTFPRPKGV